MDRQLHDQQKRAKLSKALQLGSDELRKIGSGVPWWRVDVLRKDGRTVVLEGGTVVLVITDWRREQMIRYVRAFDQSRVLLLDVASRHELPSPVAERLLALAEGVTGIDTELHPPKRALGPYRDATTAISESRVAVDPEQ